MGAYINIGNAGFQSVRNGEYVDKSGLINIVNGTLFTERRFSCVSRSRRFGKSVAAKMLCAYYDCSCDSRHLFADLSIASDPSFEKHLNKYPVIYLDLTNFTTRFKDDSIMAHVQKELKDDIHDAYPDVPLKDDDDLMAYLIRVVDSSRQPFIFIIDEWDAICREFKAGTHAMDEYVSWLRRMFKGSNSPQVFAGVYMTGILPRWRNMPTTCCLWASPTIATASSIIAGLKGLRDMFLKEKSGGNHCGLRPIFIMSNANQNVVGALSAPASASK